MEYILWRYRNLSAIVHTTWRRPKHGGDRMLAGHPTLDLDEEVEMQGEGKRGAGYQPHPGLEDTEEPTQPALPQFSSAKPAYHPENEIDMHEGAGGVKRVKTEQEENSHNEKWSKREGIKRRLQYEPTQPTLHQS